MIDKYHKLNIKAENEHEKFQNILPLIQPHYNNLVSRFSKSYLLGTSYYIGNNLLEWWNNYNIKFYMEKKKKLEHIIEMILIDKNCNI